MTTNWFRLSWLLNALVLTGCLAVSMVGRAQTPVCTTNCPGDNAVWNGSPTPSHAFIDAGQLGNANDDICTKINDALQQLAQATTMASGGTSIYNDEGVIDARGVSNLTCTSLDSNPWVGFAYGTNRPPYSTILLPSGTILIAAPWTLAARTRLIGQGSCFGSACSSSPLPLTTIKASGFSPGNAALLQMGGQYGGQYYVCPAGECKQKITAHNCNGVVIEHLMLDGNNIAGGIENDYSEELSTVSDVAMVNIATGGTGLKLTQHDRTENSPGYDADNSGPYSNLYISGSGMCVNINNTHGTRGIHGLSCVSTAQTQGAVIQLDGYNNTLEDVSIYGQQVTDGILIGSQGPTANANLLLNITGDGNETNLIHICGSSAQGNCTSPSSPTDLTIMGVSGSNGQVTIKDDLTGRSLTDAHEGMYLIGDAVGGGYSRFTTSLAVPTWLVGAGPPPLPPYNCPALGAGDLYSDTSTGSTNDTLWGCVNTSSSGLVWQQIE